MRYSTSDMDGFGVERSKVKVMVRVYSNTAWVRILITHADSVVGFSSQSVCLSVCPQHNSKPNDTKVFKLGVMTLGYTRSGTVLGFKGQRSRSQGQ